MKGKKITRRNEHGSTKGKSYLTILTKFYNETTTLIDEGRAVDIVCLDFSNSAFCIIFSKTFIDKLLTYGLDGQSVGWCICYNTQLPTEHFCAVTEAEDTMGAAVSSLFWLLQLPTFCVTCNLVPDGEAACYHRPLHVCYQVLQANMHSNPMQFMSVVIFSGGR